MKRALFLDRDGIFNEVVFRDGAIHSPRNWEEVHHYPGLEVLATIRESGYALVLVTNQPDVERGIVSEAFLAELHGYYQEKFGLEGVYVCPFADNNHPDKKPNPGLFFRAAAELGIDLGHSFHLGDTERDTLAAKRCGCQSILWSRSYNLELAADFRVATPTELLDLLKLKQ